MMKIVMFAYSNTPHLDDWKNSFINTGADVSFVLDPVSDEDILNACEDKEVVVTLVTPLNKNIIQRLGSSVRRIVIASMGCDFVDVAAARKRGIEVVNIPGYAVEEVAVHQMALALNLMRRVNVYSDLVKSGGWTDPDFALDVYVPRLSTLTYGLVGFGQIARKVTEYASAFGMKVIAYDPYITPKEIEDSKAVAKASAEEVYREADIISPNLPLTDETYHMISTGQFDIMKDGVFIVNTGRGAVIDTDALIEALKSKKVAAFACDVYEKEPFNDTDCPLTSMDNCIMTPHIAYMSADSLKQLISETVSVAVSDKP